MFGTIGKLIVVAGLALEALLELYAAGKYSSGYKEIKEGSSARNNALGGFLISVVLILLLV